LIDFIKFKQFVITLWTCVKVWACMNNKIKNLYPMTLQFFSFLAPFFLLNILNTMTESIQGILFSHENLHFMSYAWLTAQLLWSISELDSLSYKMEISFNVDGFLDFCEVEYETFSYFARCHEIFILNKSTQPLILTDSKCSQFSWNF